MHISYGAAQMMICIALYIAVSISVCVAVHIAVHVAVHVAVRVAVSLLHTVSSSSFSILAPRLCLSFFAKDDTMGDPPPPPPREGLPLP